MLQKNVCNMLRQTRQESFFTDNLCSKNKDYKHTALQRKPLFPNNFQTAAANPPHIPTVTGELIACGNYETK